MKNKVIKTLAITLSMCAIAPLGSFSASAKTNNWDSAWTGGSGYCNTKFGTIHSYCDSKNTSAGTKRACCVRDKGDSSSMYIYNKSSKAVEVKFWGEISWIDPARFWVGQCEEYPRSYFDCKVEVPANSERLVPQFINENGYDYAHVHFDTSDTNGLWSADSTGWYPSVY